MKNTKIAITLDNNIPTITKKRHKNNSYLSVVAQVKKNPGAKLSPVDSCHTHIRIPGTLQKAFDSKFCTLVNPSNQRFIDVIIEETESKDPELIEVTPYITNALELTEDSELVICKQNYCQFDTVKVQTLSNIKDDVIVLPSGSYIEETVKEFFLFEIINPLTNDSIYVRSKHIVFDPALKSNEIRLNKKQRNMLSDNIPTRLSVKQWNELMQCVAEDDRKDAIMRAYNRDIDGYTIAAPVDVMDFNVKRSLQKYLKSKFGENLIVRPVVESFHYEKKKKLHRSLCDFYVGKSTLSLNCRRPHECDENSDIVRMSENNMLLLGIEPMDKVIIRFKESEVSSHVLPFCDDKFERTNTPSILELSIGIPAHIRNKLGITDIQSSVKVDRDTVFIFKKGFNDQLVPIILTLLSLKFFEQLAWYVSLALVIVLIPIVMYITLSSKRNMRGR